MLLPIFDMDALSIFRSNYIPDELFNFYVQRRRVFRNGSQLWAICVEVNGDPSRRLTIEQIKGTKEKAINRLKEILSYKEVKGV